MDTNCRMCSVNGQNTFKKNSHADDDNTNYGVVVMITISWPPIRF